MIFACEVLENCVIIGQYRTVVLRSDVMPEERKAEALPTITKSALIAFALAILVVLIVAIPLAVLGDNLNDNAVMIIEGISKVVASICIMQLSVKIPGWLHIYHKVSILPWKKIDPAKHKDLDNLSNKEIYFNVAWNIWREVAECGVFLLPFFLDGKDLKGIPISALVGLVISLLLGALIYYANHKMKNEFWLAFFMSGLTLFLAVGLFVGGCHEFEEVWGETKKFGQLTMTFGVTRIYPWSC